MILIVNGTANVNVYLDMTFYNFRVRQRNHIPTGSVDISVKWERICVLYPGRDTPLSLKVVVIVSFEG